MKNLFISILLLLSLSLFSQDYSLDNKLYKTISWNEFFNRLEKNPHLVFFDIRTEGERRDTSQYEETNQGRIRGALQADYYQFDKYYPDFLKHKDDTIYLYCSHSMRSRRLAKQLSDSSFKNVISINGGMYYLNLMGNKTFPLRKKYYESDLKYHLVTSLEFGSKLKEKNVQVIDVRPDSIYNGTGGDEQDRSYGFVRGVKHIDNSKCIDSIHLFNKSKEIILIDNYGDVSASVANKLISKGYKNISVLFFGLDDICSHIVSSQRTYLQLKYPVILPSELLTLKKKNDVVIIDIRTASEFASTDTARWKNVGRLKDAVNIPLADLNETSLKPYRNKKIVIYDNMMMPPEIYRSGDILKKYGVKDFTLLSNGITQIKWEMANLGKTELKELIAE
ncbi:MAG TPA: rhodanese-like domain-containing protein [Puia sp.]|nr:rhodanese-like domain-containing protein [Puia sp.]